MYLNRVSIGNLTHDIVFVSTWSYKIYCNTF